MSQHCSTQSFLESLTGRAEDVICIPRILIEFAGSLETALLLNRSIFEAQRTPDGWFARSDQDWETTEYLTPYLVKKAIQFLSSMGITVAKAKRHIRRAGNYSNTWHYRLDLTQFTAAFSKFLNMKNSNLENSELEKFPVQNIPSSTPPSEPEKVQVPIENLDLDSRDPVEEGDPDKKDSAAAVAPAISPLAELHETGEVILPITEPETSTPGKSEEPTPGSATPPSFPNAVAAPQGYVTRYASGSGYTAHFVPPGAAESACGELAHYFRTEPRPGVTYRVCAKCKKAIEGTPKATPTLPTDADLDTMQPHVAIIYAWHYAIPDDVRPVGAPNVSRNAKVGADLRDAGLKWQQVRAFVRETYSTYRSWARKNSAPAVMSLEHVAKYIKAWIAKSPSTTPTATAEQPAANNQTFDFEAANRQYRQKMGWEE
jgi:hypothetical protein